MDDYFTDEKIQELIGNHNWELVEDGEGFFLLRQRGAHYMTTKSFKASEQIVRQFLTAGDNNDQI